MDNLILQAIIVKLEAENAELKDLLKEAGRKCNDKNCSTSYCKRFDKVFPEQVSRLGSTPFG